MAPIDYAGIINSLLGFLTGPVALPALAVLLGVGGC